MTGVSRCGRVRKKSSKLMDFQSPDEIDAKPSKISRNTKSSVKAVTIHPTHTRPSPIFIGGTSVVSPPPFRFEKQPLDIKAEPIDMDMTPSLDNLDDMDSSFSDDSENQLQIDTTVRHSAYMTEKSSKKKVTKEV